MKTITTAITAVLLLLTSPGALAQEGGILGTIMEAAAAQENANNQAQSEANSQAQSEAAAAWQEHWEKQMEKNQEILDALDTKYLKSTAMMVLYVGNYLNLIHRNRLGNITMNQCDAYGMELLVLASSTTIIYIPEEMAQLSDEKLKLIGEDFLDKMDDFQTAAIHEYGGDHIIGALLEYIRRSFYQAVSEQDVGDLSFDYPAQVEPFYLMKYMIEFFRPRYIIPRTLEIGRKMEALGCSKPN